MRFYGKIRSERKKEQRKALMEDKIWWLERFEGTKRGLGSGRSHLMVCILGYFLII